MIIIHFGLSSVFFTIGFLMRYGLSKSLVIYFYHKIPKLSAEEFDEISVRRFVGETSIKLGSVIFLIAMVGLLKPEIFTQAIIMGWLCFAILAVGLVIFLDKFNIVKKLKKASTVRAAATRGNASEQEIKQPLPRK